MKGGSTILPESDLAGETSPAGRQRNTSRKIEPEDIGEDGRWSTAAIDAALRGGDRGRPLWHAWLYLGLPDETPACGDKPA